MLGQPSLFPEFDKPTKKRKFHDSFRRGIQSGELKTTRDAYLYTLQEGFPAEEARIIVSQMISEGLLEKRRYPMSYETAYKDALKIRDFVLTKKGASL